jgi:hypothetical protein
MPLDPRGNVGEFVLALFIIGKNNAANPPSSPFRWGSGN